MSEKYNDEATIELHKEELEIIKNRIETANVKIYKKTFTEEQHFTVPVTREEMIIEKNTGGKVETIRIPLVEEQVEITKHPVILEDVDVYKHEYQELIHVDETLKREIVHVDKAGNITIKEE